MPYKVIHIKCMEAVHREYTLQRYLTETRLWLTINYRHLRGKLNIATFLK